MVAPTQLGVRSGTPVVAMHADGAAAVEKLRAEGVRLERAAGPGVVEVLVSDGNVDRWELHLAHRGRPLSAISRHSPEAVATIALAVARTLVAVHRNGVVHGRLSAETVLLGAKGDVVLAGLGPDDGGQTPADDVAALGRLMHALLDAPGARSANARRRLGREHTARRRLLEIADFATNPSDHRRPSASQMARLLEARAEASRPPTTEAQHQPRHLAAARRRSTVLPLAAAVLAGALVLGCIRLAGGGQSTTATPRTTTMEGQPDEANTPCVRVRSPSACAAEVHVDGTSVVVDAQVYEVGQRGDRVLLGDWDCDGGATAAVLRPSTGEVFVFATWAASSDVRVRAVDLDPVRALRTMPGRRPDCPRLVAEMADGSRSTVVVDARH